MNISECGLVGVVIIAAPIRFSSYCCAPPVEYFVHVCNLGLNTNCRQNFWEVFKALSVMLQALCQ